MKKIFYSFLFQQKNSVFRFELFVYTTIAIVITTILTGPFDEINIQYYSLIGSEEYDYLDFFLKNSSVYRSLRFGSILLLLFSLLKRSRRLMFPLSTLAVSALQYQSYLMMPSKWNYNTYFMLFMILISLVLVFRNKKNEAYLTSFSLSFPIFYIGTLYFQAGLSKIVHGGYEWVLGGTTLMQHSYIRSQNLINFFSFDTFFYQVASGATIVFEISIIFLIFISRLYPYIATLLISFHLLIYLFMGISFWNLFLFYPSLLIFLNGGFKSPTTLQLKSNQP